jgi:hypothetical protein
LSLKYDLCYISWCIKDRILKDHTNLKITLFFIEERRQNKAKEGLILFKEEFIVTLLGKPSSELYLEGEFCI